MTKVLETRVATLERSVKSVRAELTAVRREIHEMRASTVIDDPPRRRRAPLSDEEKAKANKLRAAKARAAKATGTGKAAVSPTAARRIRKQLDALEGDNT